MWSGASFLKRNERRQICRLSFRLRILACDRVMCDYMIRYKGVNGVFEGEYVDGARSGLGKFVMANGDMYEGEFKGKIINNLFCDQLNLWFVCIYCK